jgi:hypothetical protein
MWDRRRTVSDTKPDTSDALARSATWTGNMNEARERGNERKAEECYRKATFWLDRYNKLVGDGGS